MGHIGSVPTLDVHAKFSPLTDELPLQTKKGGHCPYILPIKYGYYRENIGKIRLLQGKYRENTAVTGKM
jgi:hypothetical protein